MKPGSALFPALLAQTRTILVYGRHCYIHRTHYLRCDFKLSCSFGPFHSVWPRLQVDESREGLLDS